MAGDRGGLGRTGERGLYLPCALAEVAWRVLKRKKDGRKDPTSNIYPDKGGDPLSPAKAEWPDGVIWEIPNLLSREAPEKYKNKIKQQHIT